MTHENKDFLEEREQNLKVYPVTSVSVAYSKQMGNVGLLLTTSFLLISPFELPMEDRVGSLVGFL